MSPRPSIVPLDTGDSPTSDIGAGTTVTQPEAPPKEPARGNCRVCLKAFRGHQLDQARSCAECSQRVCEDCASYSKMDDGEDTRNWTCSVCRRNCNGGTPKRVWAAVRVPMVCLWGASGAAWHPLGAPSYAGTLMCRLHHSRNSKVEIWKAII
ncbi:unnamed protein product [Acanthoscelides obtectus]|uniref:Uncharacterized protein n=1 Tax=Acanthoscelides obtectus TaxID=200917 RepID=A0A9P0VUM1_ACAOB|nr:unnamed protein product [Acanthoscelides obtectus]CAK1675482.1 hypothetical protein AOBTE_LOCUS30248 [Acanthoscelides obtectus]